MMSQWGLMNGSIGTVGREGRGSCWRIEGTYGSTGRGEYVGVGKEHV